MSHLLEVVNLKTEFKTDRGIAQAVRGVNFSLHAGQTMGLVGESGCGKSVTAKSILRLLPAPYGEITNGSILFDGKDIVKKSKREMEELRGNEISMIFQDPMTSLNPVLPIGEQVAEVFIHHKKMSKKKAMEQTVELLRSISIPSPEKRIHQYPHEFSGGMLQRIMIAIALACRPKLLIADEPTTALDVTIQAQILRLMKKLQKDLGMAILMITHDLGVVAEVCDHVSVMYAGQIIETADVRTLFKDPKHPYTWGLLGSIPKLGERRNRLNPIEGSPPSLIQPSPGCAFAGRCPFVTDACREIPQQLMVAGEGHWVACHRVGEIEREGLTYESSAARG